MADKNQNKYHFIRKKIQKNNTVNIHFLAILLYKYLSTNLRKTDKIFHKIFIT